MNRRDFLKLSSLAGVSAFVLPEFAKAFPAKTNADEEPHFFVFAYIPGGVDLSYLWDSRPLAMKAANLRADYLGEEPTLYTAGNGQTTLVSSLFNPLKSYANQFSIVNGIHMSSDFDGHEQNTNLLMTGNPFGGEFFVPHLNTSKSPLDAVSNGATGAIVSNDSKIAPLDQATLKTLSERVGRAKALSQGNPLFEALARRYQGLASLQGGTSLSLASDLLYSGLVGHEKLRQDFASLTIDGTTKDPLAAYLNSALPLFNLGSTRALFLRLTGFGGISPDTHDPAGAAKTPALLKKVVASMVTILEALKNTPYKNGKSYADVTTFIFTTEFGRTNRQKDHSLDHTGTDHNPFNNSCLIGGKGIATGQVIGASDLQTPTEILSQAHLQIDPDLLKNFGRPYDFKLGKVRDDLPSTYVKSDYITSASLVNTIYQLFNVNASHYRANGRNEAPAPTISRLIASKM